MDRTWPNLGNPESLLYPEATTEQAIQAFAPVQTFHALLSVVQAAFLWTVFGVATVLFLFVAAAMVPMLFGNRTLVVLSGSMAPTILPGAAVVVQPYPSKDLQIGDVIAYNPSPDARMPTIHRIADVREKNGVRYYTTRGDANNNADVAEIALPQTAWRVWYDLPFVGYIISYAVSPLGVLTLIVGPLLVLLTMSALHWLKSFRTALSF